jgi:hypothetical protein
MDSRPAFVMETSTEAMRIEMTRGATLFSTSTVEALAGAPTT